MQHRSYPTRPGTPTAPAVPPFALHLLAAWLVGRLLSRVWPRAGSSRDQEAAERAGERRRCPICRPERPDRHARLAFLVAWLCANGLDQEKAG